MSDIIFDPNDFDDDDKTLIQYKPNDNGSPVPVIKPAANALVLKYGGMEKIDYSVMRQNYITRLRNTVFNQDNVKGISSGGANYVTCLYNVVNEDKKDPYACGGMKKFKDAYGSSDKYCVVNLDEY